jgi:hypothetical protein
MRRRHRARNDHVRWYPTHDNHPLRAGVSTDADLVLATTHANAHFEWAFLPRLTNG